MRKTLLVLALILGAAMPALSSTTTVTGTIADSNGQIFANGTWTATLQSSSGATQGPFFVNGVQLTQSQTNIAGSFDGTGSFSTTLTSNPSITPTGTVWSFQVCPAASSPCFTQTLNIFGASQNISTSIIPPPISVNASQFGQPSAYQDSEIIGPILGFDYYNQTLQLLRLCTGSVPCTWVNVGAGGGGGGTLTGGGTANNFALWTGASALGNAPMSVASGVTLSSNPFSVNGPLLFPCTNAASGTTQNLLETEDSNGNCITLPNGNTSRISGVCFSGCGTSGTSQSATFGATPLQIDNQTAINDYIVAGANGQGHDAGAAFPTGVQVIGLAETVNAGAGTVASVDISILNILNAAGTSGISLQVNGTNTAGSFNNFGNTPAAQSNFLNVTWQTDNGAPTSNISAEVNYASPSQIGVLQLAQDLGNTALLPKVTGIQGIPVTFSGVATNDVICFSSLVSIVNCKQGVHMTEISANTYAITTANRLQNIYFQAASGATAVTLVSAATVTPDFTLLVTNAQPSGNVTITPTTSTIQGASTKVINPGQFCFIYSDNTNYFVNCGTSSGGGGISQAYQTVQNSGTPVTQRSTLNFKPAGSANINCVDNSGASSTDCTVTGVNGPPSPTVNTITGTSYTIANSDNSWRDVFTSASAVAVTLPQAGQISSAAFVANHAAVGFSGTNNTSAAFSQSAGNRLFVVITYISSTGTAVNSVTDAALDSFSRLQPDQNSTSAGNTYVQSVWVASPIAASGSNTVNYVLSSSPLSGVSQLQINEYASTTTDNSATATSSSSTTVNSTIPVSFANAIGISFEGRDGACSSGWTQRSTVNSTNQTCDRLLSSVASVSYATTTNSTGAQLLLADYGVSGSITFAAGWYVVLENTGTNMVTVTPTVSTINTRSTLLIPPNGCYAVMSDGTNYNAISCTIPNEQVNGALGSAIMTGAAPLNVDAHTTAYTAQVIGAASVTASYRINVGVGCTTSTATATVVPSIGYTDASSNVHVVTLPTANCATVTVTGADSYASVIVRAKTATNFTVTTVLANSPTYSIHADVEQLSTN